jgi:putative transposase
MARLPRIDLPGVPQHVRQRGNNRQPCFLDDNDRRNYLELLAKALRDTGCRLHAYVLMDNHAHLLLTPPSPGATGRMMQQLGRRYVGLFNARHGRSGTLWEGRYRACLVESEHHLLRCARYIDLNPVRARITASACDYRWSSCAALCGLRHDSLLTLHAAQLATGPSAQARGQAYRALLDEGVPEAEMQAIRLYLQQQRAWGRDDFRAMVESTTRRFATPRPAHRPADGRSK